MYQTGKRLLITPGMIELGDLHEIENRKLGELASQYASHIILVGKEQTKPILDGIHSSAFDMSNVQVKDTLSEAVDWYQEHLTAGDTVLFLNDLPDTY
jgi:UDP-N-acetylmuramoyl-tripeptide--D-alanyl-D-alanine ligase